MRPGKHRKKSAVGRTHCGSVALLIGGCFLGQSTAAVAAASAQLEEVIVTAQKQEENLQSVPLAITAITGADLERQGIATVAGVVQATPSISFTPFPSSSNTLILYMRGMGNSNPALLTSEGAVGMYQDGFIIARPNAATFDLADIERVEVLRGPQGTLYGRNTTGGAINLIGKQPSGEFALKQKLEFGTRDRFRSLTAIDLPAWRGLATKITYLRSSIDGYVKNSGSTHDYGEEAQRGARLSNHWAASDNFSVDYFFEKGKLDSTPIYYQNASLEGITLVPGYPYTNAASPRRHTYRPIDLALSTADFVAHGLTLAWDINPDLTLRSLTGYRRLQTEDMQDYAEAFGYTYITTNQLDTHHFSQEFTAVGNLMDGAINYTAGLYYFEESGSSAGAVEIPAFGFFSGNRLKATAKSSAAFGQLIWTPAMLEERLSLTLGARYTKDKRWARRFQHINGFASADDGTAGAVSFGRFNPSFTVNVQWTGDINTYAKVATGYRAGGLYEAAPTNQFSRTFAPEELTSYEFGLKSYWLERRVRLNIAAFEAEYKDMQLTLQADAMNVGVTQIYNAGRSTIRGVESELLLAPLEDLFFTINYSYLKGTFDNVDVIAGTLFDPAVNPQSPYAVGDDIKRLFALPHAPRHSINVGADYTFLRFAGGDLSTHIDYRWQARAYQTPAAGRAVSGRNFNSQAPYGVLNARLRLALDMPHDGQVAVALWGKNIARKSYQQHVIVAGTSVDTFAGPAGYTSNAVAWSEPASYGIDVEYQY